LAHGHDNKIKHLQIKEFYLVKKINRQKMSLDSLFIWINQPGEKINKT
jgi:hypothetical protein